MVRGGDDGITTECCTSYLIHSHPDHDFNGGGYRQVGTCNGRGVYQRGEMFLHYTRGKRWVFSDKACDTMGGAHAWFVGSEGAMCPHHNESIWVAVCEPWITRVR